jgi:YHS domain-containing protein
MGSFSRRAVTAGLAALLALPFRGALAAEAAPRPGKRVALQGYDPVSYFTEGRPEKGSAEFSAAFEDATYWFKNAEHRALFVADPDRYAPQFGGWCAMSLARGEVVEPDPESWAIAEGKLYVFGQKIGPALFAEHRADNVERAIQNWRNVRQRP